MKRYEVELLPAAYSGLEEIFDYIMADHPQAAANMLEHIMISLSRLENYPHSGKSLWDRSLKMFSFRMVIIDPYIALYRFIDNRVLVYRILHGTRKYSHLLKDTIE